MLVLQTIDSLQFQYYFAATNKISYIIFCQRHAIINDIQSCLTFKWYAPPLQLNGQSLLINILKKAFTQHIVYILSRTNDSIALILINQFHH